VWTGSRSASVFDRCTNELVDLSGMAITVLDDA
jgi:hypothetical protein